MKSHVLFKHVISNVVIALVIVSVIAVALSGGVVAVSGKPRAIYKGGSKTNVSLMVNVYWGTEYLDSMLNIFEQQGVKTTFFVGGSWAVANQEMLKKIYQKGHEIGNHGYYHKDHKNISRERNREEIAVTHALVKDILGIDMTLFAPPSGSFSDVTLEVAAQLGYQTVMWTNDTIDWRDKDKTLIFNRAIKNISGGTLVLMHPTYATIDALGDIIAKIKSLGLNITPVSQALSDNNIFW
ncbi:MAG: polysaccharide deacetylase family protein [Firmicutes bacterium]|nr:polysaccharide deacetylase family protein [Bacillota bacterium]